MAVVLAVRGNGQYYKLFPGVNTMDALSGRNFWEDDQYDPFPRAGWGHFQAWMPDSGVVSAAPPRFEPPWRRGLRERRRRPAPTAPPSLPPSRAPPHARHRARESTRSARRAATPVRP
eukprot:2942876-Prymnesium_polylepis.1